MAHHGNGPIPARIMIVGEAWGADEEREGIPFVGAAGQELNRELHEAGIMRGECFVSNVVNHRPPSNDLAAWVAFKKKDITGAHVLLKDKYVLPIVVEGYNALLAEIEAVQPNVIVPVGNLSMWALTGKWGITKWRGSLLETDFQPAFLAGGKTIRRIKVVPTYHPAAILRQWDWRAAALNDLRRVKRHSLSPEYSRPDYRFIIRPSLAQAAAVLNDLQQRATASSVPFWIDLDIETRAGHIACVGLSWSRLDAICLPFMASGRGEGYWSEEEEAQLILALYRLLGPAAPLSVHVRWQNGLYDAQYLWRWWHWVPRGRQDTMISQHALFSDQPKALAYQASLYAENYVFWKDEGKLWNPKMSEEVLWHYNLLDCVYTREVGEVELETADKMGLRAVHDAQQAMFYPVLAAMQRGVRVIKENKNALAAEIQDQIAHREQFLLDVLGHRINPRSPLQMQALFYTDLVQPPIMTRAKKGQPSHITCDDEALQRIAAREPLLKPIINAISDIRTLEIFLGNFVLAPLDADGRMRCSYNIGGSESGKSAPKTYRLSSSKSAFGSGTNLQTIPSEKSKSVGKSAQRGHVAVMGDAYSFPNIRRMFGPDANHTFFDLDLDRADLTVMAWDADEPLLKEALKRKVDIHLLNVYVLDGKEPPALEELVETHPSYPSHLGSRKIKREFSKVFCHATDYLGKARTVAAATGRTIHEIERSQKIYFGAYKGIERWQQRVISFVRAHRYVENKFGYRWHIFDRIDDQIMPEAVSWIPQSTVSIVINKIWLNLYKHLPEVQVLLQVHDSLAGQFPTHRKNFCLQRIKELSHVTIPYDDPLVIPTGISTSEVSWGDCQ